MSMFGEWPSFDSGPAASSSADERLVLFVCTGNVARSAAAECLARAKHSGMGLRFDSAGTGALVGRGVAVDLDDAVRARGADPERHEAKQLHRGIVEAAGCILVAEVEHRDWLIEEWPELAGRTALLREAAEVVARGTVPADGPRGVAPAARLVAACGHDAQWGIDDPYHRGPAAAERAVSAVEAALDVLLPWYAAQLEARH